MINIARRIHECIRILTNLKCHLSLQYIPSRLNPSDFHSKSHERAFTLIKSKEWIEGPSLWKNKNICRDTFPLYVTWDGDSEVWHKKVLETELQSCKCLSCAETDSDFLLDVYFNYSSKNCSEKKFHLTLRHFRPQIKLNKLRTLRLLTSETSNEISTLNDPSPSQITWKALLKTIDEHFPRLNHVYLRNLLKTHKLEKAIITLSKQILLLLNETQLQFLGFHLTRIKDISRNNHIFLKVGFITYCKLSTTIYPIEGKYKNITYIHGFLFSKERFSLGFNNLILKTPGLIPFVSSKDHLFLNKVFNYHHEVSKEIHITCQSFLMSQIRGCGPLALNFQSMKNFIKSSLKRCYFCLKKQPELSPKFIHKLGDPQILKALQSNSPIFQTLYFDSFGQISYKFHLKARKSFAQCAVIFSMDLYSNFIAFEVCHDLTIDQVCAAIQRLCDRFIKPQSIIADALTTFQSLSINGNNASIMKNLGINFQTRQPYHSFSNRAEATIGFWKNTLKNFLGEKTLYNADLTIIDLINTLNHCTTLVNNMPVNPTNFSLGFCPNEIVAPNLYSHTSIEKIIYFLAYQNDNNFGLDLKNLALKAYAEQLRRHLITLAFSYTDDRNKRGETEICKLNSVCFFKRNNVWRICQVVKLNDNSMCTVKFYNTVTKQVENIDIHLRLLRLFFNPDQPYF